MTIPASQLKHNMIVELGIGTGRVDFAEPASYGRYEVKIDGLGGYGGLWAFVSPNHPFTLDTHEERTP